MAVGACAFDTERLGVAGWHEAGRSPVALAETVAAMLSEPVTRWLPPDWQGPYSVERAARWIEDQDREGAVSLIERRETGRPLGLVLLFEEPVEGGVDLRLGYLLAESAWGHGYGGELLVGLVAWCAEQAEVRSVTGGVAPQNVASIRLLERAGFTRVDDAGGEWMYRLDFA